MSASVAFSTNKAATHEIADHLRYCDAKFVPPLSGRVNIDEYARKIVDRAVRFEAWSGNSLVGLVASYCNDFEHMTAYITSISILPEWKGQRIAAKLLDMCVAHATPLGMRQISLEVAPENSVAVGLYRERGFIEWERNSPMLKMRLVIEGKDQK